ncbi:MAG: NOG1 family protein [Candidatus Methanofastidiosia archaeon]
MYKNVPTIKIDEIINKAFSKSSKIVMKQSGPKDVVFRKKEIEKVSKSCQILSSSLQKVIDRYPSINNLDNFDKRMFDILAGIDETKHNLGALDWAIKSINRVRKETIREMRQTKNRDKIISLRAKAYGRYKSILTQISSNIEMLNDAKDRLKEMPSIDTDCYTVVIAGYPNVGKSSLLSSLTTSTPHIASYPFTTTGINVGGFYVKYQKIQIIDTPGLLDRLFSKRNEIELKAISAIRYLADIIIFIIDGSESRHYTLEKQYSLLEDIRTRMGDVLIITVQNKSDIESAKTDADIKISAKNGSGIAELKAKLESAILHDPEFIKKKEFETKIEEVE